MTDTKPYTPAADRLDAARPGYEDAKGVFFRLHSSRFNDMTKSQLMTTGYVAIHESYSKAELVEDAVNHLWREEPRYKEWSQLEENAKTEAMILNLVEKAREERNSALNSVRTVADGYGKERTYHIENLRGCVSQLQRKEVEHGLWQRVLEHSGPESVKYEPTGALRKVIFEAISSALDDLEDNGDVADARFRARWVRKHAPLIGLDNL